MNKIRMVIADADYEYIKPIQAKIAAEYYHHVTLEIITDREYFARLLSVPQKIDILLVSEAFYDEAISRHEVKNVFCLKEPGTAELPVDCIDKYSNVKEILCFVFGKSQDTLSEKNTDVKKKTRVVAVYSANGGVGKTSVALGLSVCLANSYQSVLYVEAGRLSAFQAYLDDKKPITDSNVYMKADGQEKSVYSILNQSVRKQEFSYLPAFKAPLLSLNYPFEIYESFVREAKEKNAYDIIIVDCDCTFDESKARLLSLADKALVVTGQGAGSVFALKQLCAALSGIKSGKYVFVCNRFDKKKQNLLTEKENAVAFPINEYIEQMDEEDGNVIRQLSVHEAIRRIAFLLI